MANVLVNDASLQDIADAIREKNGTEETYKPAEMGDAVRAIESGGNGIIYKEFDEYGLPKVVDASSLEKPDITSLDIFNYMFYNVNAGIGKGLYTNMEEIILPNWVEFISSYMFYSCSSLKTIKGDFTNVKKLSAFAFGRCKSIQKVPYMPNLDETVGSVFNACTGLESFNFYNKDIVGLSSSTFQNCGNLKDIYVPWAEGEVANAPWGATGATIHYNTTYDENHEPIV